MVKSSDMFDNLVETPDELLPSEFDFDVAIQFQKGVLEKKEYTNQFNLLVRNGIYFPNDALSALLPPETVLQMRLHQNHQDLWTLRVSKFYAVKRILDILATFFSENNLKYIKE